VNERGAPSSPVRVAHVVEALEVGGLEKLIVELARHTDRARFAACVMTLGERGRLADEVESLGWPVYPLHARPGLKPRAVLRLAGLFRREAVDVVHTHSEGPLLYGTAAARLARVGRVIHTRHHGPDLGNPRHIMTLMALAARWVDRVACVADDGARHALAEGVPAAKLVTVWNGIDLARFAYRGPVPRGPAVAVARLNPEKDHVSLLHAVALAIRAEPAFRLEIAGDGPCEAELKALATRLGLGDAVRFLGQVDDVPALLARAGLLVQPSLLEGIALTLLEAMARGLPVVATRVGGNPEVVVDGQTGRLVPARAPGPLADAMLDLWRDPERSRQLGRAGRERAERCFDVRRTAARYEQLYTGTDRHKSDPGPDCRAAGPAPAEISAR
jgi:glycosyltransferase involved in cell wall biosynthesis